MARRDIEDDEEEDLEDDEEEEQPKKKSKVSKETPQPEIVEVEITNGLLNQKLNYIIAKVEEILKLAKN